MKGGYAVIRRIKWDNNVNGASFHVVGIPCATIEGARDIIEDCKVKDANSPDLHAAAIEVGYHIVFGIT